MGSNWSYWVQILPMHVNSEPTVGMSKAPNVNLDQ